MAGFSIHGPADWRLGLNSGNTLTRTDSRINKIKIQLFSVVGSVWKSYQRTHYLPAMYELTNNYYKSSRPH